MVRHKSPMLIAVLTLMLAAGTAARAQRIAVVAPVETATSTRFAEEFEAAAGRVARVIDGSLASAAFRSANPETPFNMTVEQGRIIGSAIGCEYFVVIRADVINRYSLAKKEYFEAFAAIATVSARTGRLIDFRVSSAEGKRSDAETGLIGSAGAVATDLISKLPEVTRRELSERPSERFPEVPAEGSADARGFRPALPYRRLSPQYTPAADLYGVTATVDIEAEIDGSGKIIRTEIVRWAGFGLDQSVEKAIRSMNWRPAERDGRPGPIRILLRYNFRKKE